MPAKAVHLVREVSVLGTLQEVHRSCFNNLTLSGVG
jgi:hypothetical protein